MVRGRLHPVPEGFMVMEPRALWPLVTSPLLSWRGKARVLGEYFVAARRDGQDESLASFARRRFGRKAFERLVQPLAAGIYTADPEQLSLAATMPRFLEMERQHGGLIRRRSVSKQFRPGRRKRGAAPTACSSRRENRDTALATAVAANCLRKPCGLTPVSRLAVAGGDSGGGWDIVARSSQAQPGAFRRRDPGPSGPGQHTWCSRWTTRSAHALEAIPYASSAVVVSSTKIRN